VVQYSRTFTERSAEQPAGTYGTRGTPADLQDILILNEGIEGGPDLTEEVDARSAFGPGAIDDAGKRYRGTITTKARVDELGKLLLSLFGKVTTTSLGGVPAAIQHIYVPLDDLVPVAPSLGIDLGVEKKREYRYSGVLIDECQISKTNAGEINIIWTLIAKDRTANAYDGAVTPVFSTKGKLQTVQVATLGGTSVTWDSLTINLRRNWDKTFNFSGRTQPNAEIGMFDVEVSGSLKFENATPNFINTFEAKTEVEATIEFRGVVISGANFETLRIEMDRMQVMDVTPAHIGPSRKVESIRLKGLVPSTGDWCKGTLVKEGTTPATYP